MNVEIGTEAPIFLFWEYFWHFRHFVFAVYFNVWLSLLLTGGFLYFLWTLFSSASDSTVPEDAGIEPRDRSQPRSAISHPHSVRSHPHSVRSHPHSVRSHPQSAISHPHSAISHPQSAISHPQSAISHPQLG
jgi:hypothetical protein